MKTSSGMIKKKIIELIGIFNSWKEYTNILALTSAQVIKNRFDARN